MPLSQRSIVYLLLATIAPLFFVTGPAFEAPRSVLAVWDLGHVVFFALLAVALYDYWLPASYPPIKKILCIVLFAGVLGLVIEFLQLGVASRTVGWADLLRDLAGSAIVSFWKMAGQLPGGRWRSYLARLLAVALGVGSLLPLYHAFDDERRARKEFPVLSAFEREAELGRWRGSARMRLVTDPVRQGKYAVELLLTEEKDSGVYLFYCPGDWRGRRALAFSVNNPGSGLLVNVRVLDHLTRDGKQKIHGQYNTTVLLATGWNDIAIPLELIAAGDGSLPVALERVWAFGIFVGQSQGERSLFFDDVRLVD
jgi:VanZ family protein